MNVPQSPHSRPKCSFLRFWLLFALLFNNPALAENLLADATKQLQNGFYRIALSSYEHVLEDALRTGSLHKQRLAEAGLGHTLYLLNRPQKAIKHLKLALTLLDQKSAGVAGQIHYYLSLVSAQLKDKSAFKTHWQQSMNIANQQSDTLLQAYLQLASIKWAKDKNSFDQHLQQINSLLAGVTDKTNLAWGIIHLNLAEHLIQHQILGTLQFHEHQRIRQSHRHLQQARQYLAKADLRSHAKLMGLQGLLYETKKRYPEALNLSLQALDLAQKTSAQDLLMLYEWQSGRLYKKLERSSLAISSYRRAISHVKAIRQDIPISYQDGKSSFKELLGPLYRDLADLLLVEATQKQADEKQLLLNEARGFLEQLKQAELEDFFQDRCLIQNQQKFSLDSVAEDTAILYPVLLPDRFEWLVGIKGHLQQIQIKLSRDLLSDKIRQYTSDLRDGWDSTENQTLYQLLFKPLEPLLQQQNIKTLVYIPDGVLRLLPLSVLSDGQHYLIERYSIATLPGLNLLNARTEMAETGKSLLVGLSNPSVEAISQLPESILARLTGIRADKETSNQPIQIDNTQSSEISIEIDQTGFTNHQSRDLTDLAKEMALPGVAAEIKLLAKKLSNRVLLNEEFTLDNFQKEVVRSDYNIIHIASHGFFGGDSKDSFIMTYNKMLTIDKLENLLRGRKQDNPLNMLTLSACQTAEGDDRAPLGISGVAIKANAQTALGSLWPISDEASVKLMSTFYQQLIIEKKSKAKALQIAQQELINDPKLNKPFYWAPFILVGHWL